MKYKTEVTNNWQKGIIADFSIKAVSQEFTSCPVEHVKKREKKRMSLLNVLPLDHRQTELCKKKKEKG